MYPEKTKRWKQLLTWVLVFAMVASSITIPHTSVYAADETGGTKNSRYTMYADNDYNYAKLLQYSLYFYDANMCGELENDCSVNWRKNCHLCDKNVTYNGKSVDVSGGFHAAADHDKFILPQR